MKGEPVDIDPECVSHDEYLSEFKSMLITKLRNAIDADLSNDPDCIKGRKKTVQVSLNLCFCLIQWIIIEFVCQTEWLSGFIDMPKWQKRIINDLWCCRFEIKNALLWADFVG